MKKIVVALLILIMLIASAGCGGTSQAGNTGEVVKEKIKVALLLPGVITDAGWSAAAYEGLTEAKEKYGIETAYTESVALADQEATIRDYASRGYNLIICHGDEFGDAVKSVAPEFPDTKFAISNSDVRLDNAIGMEVMNEESGYMAGYAMGLITKTNKVGFVSSMEILPMKRTENGFRQGLKDSNPNAEAVVAYTGSFDDAALGKETAYAIFDKGVDAAFQYAQGSGIGVIQAAEEKGVPIAVTSPSQVKLAPTMAAISVKTDMKVNIIAAIDAYVNNKFDSNLKIVGTFSTGLFKVTDINKNLFNEEQIKQMDDQVKKLQNGEIKF